MSSWLDERIERNLTWRSEMILDEIHGVTREVEEVPDSPLSVSEVASAVLFKRLGRPLQAKWEAK
jgi:hypothetical protein